MRIGATALSRYADGELDPAKRAAVEQALAANAALARKLTRLRRTDAALRAAFAPILAAPPPPLLLPGEGQARPPHGRSLAALRLAMAAGLVGLGVGVGLAGGFLLGRLQAPHPATGEAAALALLETRLPSVLEREPSGAAVRLEEPASKIAGALTPQRTFKVADGSFCRLYQAHLQAEAASLESRGVACRDQAGRWRTRLQVNGA
jgi:surface antigen